jgi:hypothetical protein
MGDDYMQRARVDPRLGAPGFACAPLDLFTFVSGEPSQRAVLLEEGVFGWWMAPDFRMSFWRPLSSLTHVLDHRLWPYATLSVAWLAAYKALGYGTSGGGMYLNPLDEPAAYLGALAERLPVLAAAQVGAGLADAWLVLPPAARVAAYVGALLTLAVFAAVLAPQAGGALVPWSPPGVGESLRLPSVSPSPPTER